MIGFVCILGTFTSPSIGFEFGWCEGAKLWQPWLQIHLTTYTFTIGWIERGMIEYVPESEDTP